MSGINWSAIHAAHAEYKGRMGSSQSPVPQPQGLHPGHSMMVHAMASARNKEGEDHGTMIIRALSDLAKKTIPDVSSIHKSPTALGGA